MATPQQRRASDRLSYLRLTERGTRWIAAGIATVVLLLVGGIWVWYTLSARVVTEGAPNWSPDSRRIVFSSEHDGQADLFVMDADGGNRRQLTATPSYEGAPAFSPDGSRIAFETDRDGNYEIYVMDPAGGNLQRLTNNPASDQSPAWSPDGKRIAFMSDRGEAKRFDIYVMNADGSGVERVTSSAANWEPQFSPDGQRLAVQVDQDVKVIDLASQTVLRLTFTPQDGLSPTWSPDGRRIAFATNRDGRLELYTMTADGENQTRLVSFAHASAIEPRWSPDGTRIVFVYVPDKNGTTKTQSYGIYDVELASEKVTRLSP